MCVLQSHGRLLSLSLQLSLSAPLPTTPSSLCLFHSLFRARSLALSLSRARALSHSLARSLVVVSVGLEFRVQHSRIAGPEEEEEHEEEEEEEEEEIHGREAV
jgi:uncharacterized metal-binding protein YceD (DUF177 family)